MPNPRPNVTWETLPCGCKLAAGYENGEPTFYFEPHANDCEYYLYVINESQRQGKSATPRLVDD